MGSSVAGLGLWLAGSAAGFLALVMARGAGAGMAQPREAPRAFVAVFPVDFEAGAFGLVNAHFDRLFGVAGKLSVLVFFAPRLLGADQADAFVTHTLSIFAEA